MRKHDAETERGARIRTWEWRNQNPRVPRLISRIILKSRRNSTRFQSLGWTRIQNEPAAQRGLVVRPNHARVCDDRVPHRLAWPGLVRFSQYLCEQFYRRHSAVRPSLIETTLFPRGGASSC